MCDVFGVVKFKSNQTKTI